MKHLQSDKDSRQLAGQQPEGQRYPIVLTRDLVKYYGSGENLVRAIDHTSLDLQRGEFTAIVGRSGSGKVPFCICSADSTVLIPGRS